MECPLPAHGNPPDGPLAVVEWFTGTSRAFRFAVGTDGVILGSAPGTDIRLGIKDPPVLALFRHDGRMLFCRVLAPQCPLRVNGGSVGGHSQLKVNDHLELAGQTALVVHVALGIPLSEKVSAPELIDFARELESQATLVDEWHKSLEARESQLNHRESQWTQPIKDVPETEEPLPFFSDEPQQINSLPLTPPPSKTIEPQSTNSNPSDPSPCETLEWNPPCSWEEAEDSWEFLAFSESRTEFRQKDQVGQSFTQTETVIPEDRDQIQELDHWNHPLEDIPTALAQEEPARDPVEEIPSESLGTQQETILVPQLNDELAGVNDEVAEVEVPTVEDPAWVQPFQENSPSVILKDCTIPLGDYLCAGNLPESEPVEALSVSGGGRVFLEATSSEETINGPAPFEQENLPRELDLFLYNEQKYQVWEISSGPSLLDLDLAPVLGIWYHLVLQTTWGVRALHEAGRSLGRPGLGWVVLDPSGLVKLRGPGLRGTDPVGDLDAIGHLARSLWIKAFGAFAPQPESIKNLLGRLGSQSQEIERMESLEQLSGELDRVGLRIRNNPYAFAALLRKTFPGWPPPSSKRISA